MSATQQAQTEAKGRVLQGVVVSNKMHKTAVVKVDRRITHPEYGKVVTRSTKLHVHDPDNKCKEGDKVLIQETRPISKLKSWKLLNILGEE